MQTSIKFHEWNSPVDQIEMKSKKNHMARRKFGAPWKQNKHMCVCKGEEKGIDQRKGGEGEWQAAAEGQKLPAFSVLVPTGQEMGGRPPAVLGLDGGR